jgi:hypothetical protein
MTSRTTYYVMEVLDESASEFPENYDWDSPFSQRSHRDYVIEHRTMPSFEPKLEQEISDDPQFNKVNDFIFGPTKRYCISERVKNILTDFRLPEHRFYSVTVYQKKRLLGLIKSKAKVDSKYFAFFYDNFFIDDKLDFIDFNKTRVRTEMLNKKRILELEISTATELKDVYSRQAGISDRINELTDSNGKSKSGFEVEYEELLNNCIYKFETDKIYFNNKFDHSVDLFEIPHFSWMTYISERLMNRLKEENVTGLIFSKPGERQYLAKRPNPELRWE